MTAKKPKGEVHEIINALEHLSAQSGSRADVVQNKRECFQKLIRYMTQGIDMSAAFVPATKCVALSKQDLPLKKMLYLYLRTAAKQNPAVALLVVQTLLNDCKDLDPTIRGLAVRSMCSLRVPELMENVFQAVDGGLHDAQGYVREAAVMGVLKCHHQDPAGVRMRGLLERVEALLASDTDPQVVANCLYVMQQVGMLEGRMTRQLVVSLLNHIRAFSDWAQCFVLDLVAQYQPASEEERFDILEVLDFGLNHANSAVVMATAKLFLHFTLSFSHQHQQVLETLKDPLQTLIQGREPEVVWAVLSNFLVLAQRYPLIFSQLYPEFYCRYEDPSYLKRLKIDVLIAIADQTNAYEIAEEMTQYVKDSDEDLARAAIRAVGQIALKVPDVNGIIDRLLLFLGYEKDFVTAETLVQMTDVLRRYPDAAAACVDSVAAIPEETVVEPGARAAYLWVVGEYGAQIQDAPYVLESLSEGFSDEATEVKLALLTACLKLFFKRPPECRKALGAVLAAGVADPAQEVHDKALLYYRLLQHSVGAAQSVVDVQRPAVTSFADAQSAEIQDRIFDELNTLSVAYRAPASTFIDNDQETERFEHDSVDMGASLDKNETESALHQAQASLLDVGNTDGTATPLSARGGTPVASSSGLADLMSMGGGVADMPSQPAAPPSAAAPADLLADVFGFGGGGAAAAAPAAPAPAAATAAVAPQAVQSSGFSGLDDLLGGLGGGGGSGASAAAAPAPAAASVSLVPQPQITPHEFQQKWAAWTPSARTFQQQLSSSALASVQANGYRDFTAHIGQAHIANFATPREGSAPPLRFLFHAQAAGSSVHVLVQVTVTKAPAAASAVVKSDDPAAAQHVEELLQNLLLTL
ncbi:hypothetical protein D9Q98_001341 [Chlorella vulgaris]|uniref:Beta-adaptin-like protein n=1 Tax=Chlorella vulgaris TaxID=3077 RepID=A0A9D4U050_CHLVU|nr:hypothetical protein D9Q98_001341 [Chlorella vulgaris]